MNDKDSVNLPPEELGFLVAALGGEKADNPFLEESFEYEAWNWGWDEYHKYKEDK